MKKWKEMCLFDRIFIVIALLCCIAVCALCVLNLLDIWTEGSMFIPVLAALLMGMQFVQHLRLKNKGVAIFSLCVAVFLLIVFVVRILG